ncbi:MAG: hypothetical protein LBQ22_06885 [Bacteroidales bacterium]|jgi:hypothetical protein|nr:hypothetical protein [Bacteroidales bacterium]
MKTMKISLKQYLSKEYFAFVFVFIGMSFSPILELTGLFIALIILDPRDSIKNIISFKGKLFKTYCLFIIISAVTILFTVQKYDKFFQQAIVLLAYFLLYNNVFKKIKNTHELVKSYLDVVLGMCLYACYFMKNNRATPWGCEAGVFAGFILPGIAYLILTNKWESLRLYIMIITGYLTFSPLFLFFLLAILVYKFMLFERLLFLKTIFIIVFCLLCSSIYITENSNMVELRSKKTNETFDNFSKIFDSSPIHKSDMNESTWAFVSNMRVAIHAPNRITGAGLGTHQYSYYNYFNYFGLNCEDAYSLGIRLFSEFGIIGIILLLQFFFKNFNKYNNINVSIFWGLLYLFFRGGQYILIGTIMFFYIYYYTSKRNTELNKINLSHRC